MKKKGFTLIELLAVIVILAIIALILIPVVSDIMDDARKASAKRSVEGYVSGANSQAAVSILDDGNGLDLGDDYILETGEDDEGLDKIEVSGKAPKYVYLKFSNTDDARVEYGNFCVNGYSIDYIDGKAIDSEVDYCSGSSAERPVITVTRTSTTSSSAVIEFSVETLNAIEEYTCKAGSINGVATSSSCTLVGLSESTNYSYQICAKDSNDVTGCKSGSFQTAGGAKPVLSSTTTPATPANNYVGSQVVTVTFDGTGMTNPTYYIKSERAGVVNVATVEACGTGNEPASCEASAVTTIVADTWYRVSGNVSVTYNEASDETHTLYASLSDGEGYTGTATATIAMIDKEVPTISSSVELNTVTLTLADAKSGIESYCITSTNDYSSCTWTSTSTNQVTQVLTGGTYYGFAKDKAGNVSSSTTIELSISASDVGYTSEYTDCENVACALNELDGLLN